MTPSWLSKQHIYKPTIVHASTALTRNTSLSIALRSTIVPAELWEGQLFAGSMTLENPRIHAEWGFPNYITEDEKDEARKKGVSIGSVFGHIVPDYPKLLNVGLRGILKEVEVQQGNIQNDDEKAFLDSVTVALEGVMNFAGRLAERCDMEADNCEDADRVDELRQMAANLRGWLP